MIIDFHTHMFPDKIAGRTLDYLSGIFGASPFADGTYTGLCNSMGKGAVDISIALPAVTKVSHAGCIDQPVCICVYGRTCHLFWRDSSGM